VGGLARRISELPAHPEELERVVRRAEADQYEDLAPARPDPMRRTA